MISVKHLLHQHCVRTSHRFEPVHNGHHDISSVVPLEIEEVDGADCPKVDAGEPWQDGELKTLREVRPVCVERLIGYLQRGHKENSTVRYVLSNSPKRCLSEPSHWPAQRLWHMFKLHPHISADVLKRDEFCWHMMHNVGMSLWPGRERFGFSPAPHLRNLADTLSNSDKQQYLSLACQWTHISVN